MQILTLKPLHNAGTIDIDVVALDDSGATVTCTAQLLTDLSEIRAVTWEESAIVTEELLALVRSEVSDYIKANQAELAKMLS